MSQSMFWVLFNVLAGIPPLLFAQGTSTLDQIDPASMADEDRVPTLPKETVAVLGTRDAPEWGSLQAVAYSPDGKWLAAAHYVSRHQRLPSGVIRLWNTTTQREVTTLHMGALAPWQCLSFSPDSKSLATFSAPEGIQLWAFTASPPKVIHAFPLNIPAMFMKFIFYSPNGKLLAWSYRNGVEENETVVWDPAGNLKQEISDFNALGFTPDSSSVIGVRTTDRSLQAIKLNTEPPTILWSLPATSWGTFSASGRMLACFQNQNDPELQIYDVEQGKPTKLRAKHKLTAPPQSLILSPQGEKLACSYVDGEVELYSILGDKLQEMATFKENRRLELEIGLVSFSSDGHTLATCGKAGQVRLWDLTASPIKERGALKRHRTDGHSDSLWSLAFSPDGTQLATSSIDRSVRLWQLTGPQPKELAVFNTALEAPVWSVSFTPDGKTLACGGFGLRLWNLTKPQPWTPTVLNWDWGPAVQIATTISPDGQWLASAGRFDDSGTVQVWDLTLPAPPPPLVLETKQQADSSRVCSLSFSPKFLVLAAGIDSHGVQIWDMVGKQWKERYRVPGNPKCLEFPIEWNPTDQALAIGCTNGTIQLWDLPATQPKLRTQLTGHRERIVSLAYSPNGNMLASLDAKRRLILWNMKTNTKIREQEIPRAYPDVSRGLQFAPDSCHLAVANADGTVYLLRLNLAP